MDSQNKLHTLLPRAGIESIVMRLAAEISGDFRDKDPLLIGILKGSFVFLADLVRQLDFPLDVDFIRITSYGSETQSSGKVKVLHRLKTAVRDRHVLVVEDIIDTGHTTSFLMDYLKKKKPASLRLCALADKPSRRLAPIDIDYLGLTVPDKFIVGYGMDCDEKYRNLPDIGYLEQDKE